MGKIKILNFHNLKIDNAELIHGPLSRSLEKDDNTFNVVFIRDPYQYFDYMISDYLAQKKSLLFTQDIVKNLDKLDEISFLEWLNRLNFFPLYNNQTFHLDISKRVPEAIGNLEKFDYVVPYEKIDLFLENVFPYIGITKKLFRKYYFSLESVKGSRQAEEFVYKDNELYKRSLELWNAIEENDYKPLGMFCRNIEAKVPNQSNIYRGIAGKITADSISGWVFHKGREEVVKVAIFRNGVQLYITSANLSRDDLLKQKIHPTGKCGFEVLFDKPVFRRGDNVAVKTFPDYVGIPLGEIAKSFLGV